MALSIKNLTRGTQVRVGYRNFMPTEADTFLGFSAVSSLYGGSGVPKYDSWKALQSDLGTHTTAELQQRNDDESRTRGYGHGVYAVFGDATGRHEFTAYLFNGAWCVGSSADKAKLELPGEHI